MIKTCLANNVYFPVKQNLSYVDLLIKDNELPPYLPKGISTSYEIIFKSHHSMMISCSLDPRQWTREEVCQWVEWTCSAHSLPAPATERFLMNGKAVCLMSVAMFSARVPLGGKLLYRDFQIRLADAMADS